MSNTIYLHPALTILARLKAEEEKRILKERLGLENAGKKSKKIENKCKNRQDYAAKQE